MLRAFGACLFRAKTENTPPRAPKTITRDNSTNAMKTKYSATNTDESPCGSVSI